MNKTETTKTTVDGHEYIWTRTGEYKWETPTECGLMTLANTETGGNIGGNWYYRLKDDVKAYRLKSLAVRDAMKEALADLMN